MPSTGKGGWREGEAGEEEGGGDERYRTKEGGGYTEGGGHQGTSEKTGGRIET